MRTFVLSVAALLAAIGQARADDKAPPAPPANPVYTPALPTPGSMVPAPAPALTEAQIEAIVDRAVNRAMAANPAAPSPQSQPAFGSPQGAYQAAPQALMFATSARAPSQKVAVLVHPGPIARGLSHVGEKLTRLGEPRLRTLSLATPTVAPIATSPAPAAAVMIPLASGQSPR